MARVLLTTTDNGFDPFVDYDAWSFEDKRLGYDTEAYMARIAVEVYGWNDDMTPDEKDDILNKVIDDILTSDFLAVYRKVTKD